MNNIAFLTAKVGPDGSVYARPRVLYIPEDSILNVKPALRTNPLYPGVKSGVKINTIPGGQTIKVYETASQIEVARDPSAANVKASDKVLGGNAAGSAQGAGLDILTYLTEIDTATDTSAEAVDLPAAIAGTVRVVINNTSVALEVFPASGETINGAAANAVYDQPARSRRHYVCDVAGEWIIADDNGSGV